jgi:hypothetical protein
MLVVDPNPNHVYFPIPYVYLSGAERRSRNPNPNPNPKVMLAAHDDGSLRALLGDWPAVRAYVIYTRINDRS